MSGAQGTLPTGNAYIGTAWQFTPGVDFNAIDFLVRQIQAGKASASLVIVRAVTGGGIGTPATVDVQPMVNQVDGLGNQTPHGVVHGLPCFRLQGGNGAVILDPVVGDIGVAIICDRDISVVKATTAVSGPGSWRQNSWADGCYFGGFLNAAPTQFVHFSAGGIDIITPGTINISATRGTSIDGKAFLAHVHTGVQAGPSNTGPPA